MSEPSAFPQGSVQALIDVEMKRDRLVRWVSGIAWAATFVVLIGYGLVIAHDASRALTLARAGILQQQDVLKALVPLFLVVGVTTLLLALVSTAALFLRQRTANLADIQLRLATLEAMLAKETDGGRED